MTKDAADWKIGFKYAMIDALVKNSTPVDVDKGSFYGWMHPDYSEIRQAINAGEIDYTKTTWEEVDWHEFMGTFYEVTPARLVLMLTSYSRMAQRTSYATQAPSRN